MKGAWRIISALVVAVALAASASAQQLISDYDEAPDGREPGLLLRVEIDGETYHISIEDLLDGLVVFDDALTRYVSVRAFPADMTVPTFGAADFTGTSAASGRGFLTGISFPTLPGPPATAIWIAVAVPASTELRYASWGPVNYSLNSIQVMAIQPGGAVDIGGTNYTVWRVTNAQNLEFLTGSIMFLHQDAVSP